MSVNLPLKTWTFSKWLSHAALTLKQADIPSARLDAELILAHTIRKSRTYIHSHSDEPLDARLKDIADARLELRKERTPLAYIIGHKEFYGRLFTVTPATLIPRPESEGIISLLKKHAPLSSAADALHLVDVGTGSGCLGITAKCELPLLDVTLTDTSAEALAVAQKNARRHGANVRLLKGSLLAPYPLLPDIILANLPYVDNKWKRSPETNFEPSQALFAKNDGLALILALITQAKPRLTARGLLILEADPRQHSAIKEAAHQNDLALLEEDGFCLAFAKR
jgi:release factor glutamine methyltransferase